MSRLSRVVGALRLRHPGGPDPGRERHATWLELFFDLAFVLALVGVVGRLTGPAPTAGRLAGALGLYLIVQWAWVGQAFYDTRYDPDDVPHRLIVLIATGGAGAIAIGVGRAPAGMLLPIGYLVVRGAVLLQYLRLLTADRSAREVVAVYAAGFGTGWLLWLGSLAVPPHTRPVLWLIALAVELATPWLGRPWLNRHPVDTTHLPERLGQFTIILLGAILTEIRAAVPTTAHPPRLLAAAGVSLLAPISIWWIYTTFVSARLVVPRLGTGQEYGYLHAPAGAAILFLGWALGEIVREIGAGTHRLPWTVRLVFGGSIIGWMVCGLGLQWFAVGRLTRRRLVIAVLTITPAAVVTGVVADPVLALALAVAVLVEYAILVSPQIVRLAGR